MKKEIEATSVCVYRNPEHETTTEAELKNAQKALQAVLDVWNTLELIPCIDIFGLVLNPQKVYGSAVNQLAEPPKQAGRFQVSKSAYIQTLEVPLPDELYRAAKSARQQPFCAMPELWTVSGDKVVLDETEGKALIDSQSVYVSDPLKIELFSELNQLVEIYNSLNRKLKGELLRPNQFTYGHFEDKFKLVQKTTNDLFELSLDPAFLRSLLR